MHTFEELPLGHRVNSGNKCKEKQPWNNLSF